MRLLLGFFVLLSFSSTAGTQTASDNKYAGGEVCKKCHPAQWQTFFRNPHYKSVVSGKKPPDRTGCEGCHGPGQQHIQTFRKSAIRAFSVMEPREILDACLRCHAKDLSKGNIRRSAHTLAGVACTSCHSIHGSRSPEYLLANMQREVCYGCHTPARAQFSMPFKHPVNEGFMKCTDCHNPHGTAAPTWRMGLRPRLVDTAIATEEPCLKCHSDKRGPFTFEHPSVRVDGCETCHKPHGSTNAKLLTRPVVFTICLECHNGAGNFGRQGDGIQPQSSTHNMVDPRYQNCTACHVRIHGSNADPLFLR